MKVWPELFFAGAAIVLVIFAITRDSNALLMGIVLLLAAIYRKMK